MTGSLGGGARYAPGGARASGASDAHHAPGGPPHVVPGGAPYASGGGGAPDAPYASLGGAPDALGEVLLLVVHLVVHTMLLMMMEVHVSSSCVR